MTERPLTSPIKWIGSKARLRGKIYPIIESIPRKLYVEPFGGGGSMFFGKTPENSVYNDVNGLLVNLFRRLRSRTERELIKELANFTPSNYDYWHEFKEVCKAYQSHDDKRLESALIAANLKEYSVETAVAFCFFYCQRNSFGGSILHSYGENCKPRISNDYAVAVELLDKYAEHLAYTTITSRDFRECILKHDDVNTLFYCDPPYECKTSGDYKTSWRSTDTDDLVSILTKIKGSAVLSCYDCESYAPLLDAGYIKQDFPVTSSVRRGFDKENFDRVETVYYRAVRTTRLF